MPTLHFQRVEYTPGPKDGLPEIAVAGRSNVGKSALLNHLFGRKGLVRTSSRPGKTQAVQFFCVNDQLRFADLPGYGYAVAPKEKQATWSSEVDHYLNQREQLRLLLLLLDSRRTPGSEERELLEWTRQRGLPLILVLTKADKLKKSERAQRQREILETLEGNLPYLFYSTTENLGRAQLIAIIERELGWRS